ncbi:DUF5074 domain-containing protein [Pedobacter polysacchareus]|uniref:DUF5074 domain-containing protein n=1 Tax=Pedobacter polysacchareus TaxID=2861973 RepID=UPI001C99AF87|nr:DUF5074 domain-containing protein [Pedobacter polysacchareus]
MNIKQTIVAMFCLGILAVSCKKEETEIARLTYQAESDSLMTVKVGKELILSPQIIGKTNRYQWLENGKEVAGTATYTFKKAEPGIYNIEFVVENDKGKTSLNYRVKVLGPYGDGVLLLSYTDETGFGNSSLSHMDEDGTIQLNVFSKANPGAALSPEANNLYYFNNQYYITSSFGPNFLSVVDAQTMKLNYVVNKSAASEVTYFATTDGKTGYVNVTNRRKSGLYTVDLTNKSIGSTILEGSKEVSLVPINTVNQAIVTGAGKQLIKVEGAKVVVLNTYKENVAGVVKSGDNSYWVGVQGSTANKAKFVKLDKSNKGVDSVELTANFKVPANGILTSGGKDEYLYWQETSRGVICRFNTRTKTAEEFVDHANAGIIFATSWKVNPKNGELYVADSPEIFSGAEPFSNLFIFDKSGKLRKEVKKAGYQITDIVFPQ